VTCHSREPQSIPETFMELFKVSARVVRCALTLVRDRRPSSEAGWYD
jgi:hypothetical protein